MAEEEKKNVAVATPSEVTTAAEMKTQAQDANQFKAAFDARKQGYQSNINSTLGNSLTQQQTGLQDAYNKNLAAQGQTENAINTAYGTAQNDLGIQTNRVQTGNNNWADARNLNRGSGSQQALGLGLGRSVAAGKLAQQQNLALEENARQKQLLETSYKNQVAQAVSEHDYKRAAALLDDYNNQNTWLDKNAAAMASFGNFTGYEQMYGPETSGIMQNFWIGSNPELAYNTGVIDEERYEKITGRKPPDYVPPAGSGGGGSNDGDWWWGTVQGQMALGHDYNTALYNASGGRQGSSGGHGQGG